MWTKQKERLHFVHITDLHFATIGNRCSIIEDWIAALLHFPNFSVISTFNIQKADSLREYLAQLADLDFIIISGDLSTSGEERDVEVAYNYIYGEGIYLDGTRVVESAKSSLIQHIKPLSSSVNAPIYIIPGNHDRFTSRFVCFPGSKKFDEKFHAYWSHGQGTCITTHADKVFLIFSDFSLPEDAKLSKYKFYMGEGCAESHLQSLEHEFKKLKDLPRIWIMHFNPTVLAGTLALNFGDKIVEMAKHYQISIILCGHTHKFQESSSIIPKLICCGATTLQTVAAEECSLVHVYGTRVKNKWNFEFERKLYSTKERTWI